MIRLKTMMIAAGATLLLGGSAFAAEMHGRAGFLFVTPQTVMAMDAPSQAKIDMMMKVARKLPPGTIVYNSEGALWIAEDSKMADGKMLSDALMH